MSWGVKCSEQLFQHERLQGIMTKCYPKCDHIEEGTLKPYRLSCNWYFEGIACVVSEIGLSVIDEDIQCQSALLPNVTKFLTF